MATLIKSSYPSSVGHVDLYTSLGNVIVHYVLVLFLCRLYCLCALMDPFDTTLQKMRALLRMSFLGHISDTTLFVHNVICRQAIVHAPAARRAAPASAERGLEGSL